MAARSDILVIIKGYRMTSCLIRILVFGVVSFAVSGNIGAEELPKIVQDQLTQVQPALNKAQGEYRKKVQDENNKLITIIQKAMEKATKAGKLDDALALKSALEKAKSGELLKPYLEPSTTDLLGNDTTVSDGPAVITFSTGDPVEVLAPNKQIFNNRDYLISEVSNELQGLHFTQRPFKEPTPITIKVLTGGVLHIAVGDPPDGLDFPALGFEVTSLYVQGAAGRYAVVRKLVRAGESITLPPSAKANSFPIFKARQP
ncbi:MAG: hypothetical protein H0W78_04470 [Planctomycetes bacterium]|nr:hypothetical protein [Planctomycetota bacterium]